MIYLNELQAEVGVAAKMWTREQLETAKINPDGHIVHQYFLIKQNDKVRTDQRAGDKGFSGVLQV